MDKLHRITIFAAFIIGAAVVFGWALSGCARPQPYGKELWRVVPAQGADR